MGRWSKGCHWHQGQQQRKPDLILFKDMLLQGVCNFTDCVDAKWEDFELLDRDFLKVLQDLDDPSPYLRGIISELGFKMERVHYLQNKRERGKTKANFRTLYDFAMNGITSYSKSILRVATISGFVLSFISVVIAIITFVKKLLFWNTFEAGIAAISVGVFFLGSVQLFFIGLLGEYILNMNVRILHRPLVIEEERINFEEK